MKAKTQKAKGIFNAVSKIAQHLIIPYNYCSTDIIQYRLITQASEINDVLVTKQNPKFARPCPLKPAHGFIDSRYVYSRAEVENLFSEIKKVDPDGELILAPLYKEIKHNLIYVSDGLVSVGPGNDGATSGKDSLSFSVAPLTMTKAFYALAGVKEEDSLYFECISSKGEYYDYDNDQMWRMVQVRGGPKAIVGASDFIPKPMTVKKVVLPNDDLMAWANEVKNFDPGTVVYGNGHTLASHAAVHCIINNIPFVCSFEPKIGDTLKSANNSKKKISRAAFKKGCQYADNTDIANMGPSKTLLLVFGILHNWAYLKTDPNIGTLLGFGLTSLVKLAFSLCLGEARHSNNLVLKGTQFKGLARDSIYRKSMADSLGKTITSFDKVVDDYIFNANWKSGYGGIAWGLCSNESSELAKLIGKSFNKDSLNLTDKEILNLIEKLNNVINMAHNNGWWFNKITTKDCFDFAAKYPGLAFALSSNVAYEVIKNADKLKLKKSIPAVQTKAYPFLKKEGSIMWARILSIPSVEFADECVAQIKIGYSNSKIKSCTKFMKFTRDEIEACEIMINKAISEETHVYLKPIKNKGFQIPGGRIIAV